MGVTAGQIEAALRSVGGLGGQAWSLRTLAAGANNALAQAGITTRQGTAVFVAQCMVESAYFRTTREYGGANTRYAPYYGRGFIQVTWAANYSSFGKWCKARGLVSSANYFMAPNQDRLANDRWAWLGAVWYMTTHRHGLIALANRGDNIKVGRAINRGNAHSGYAAYGEDHRQKAYRALLNAGVTAPSKSASVGGGVAFKPSGKWSTKKIQTEVGVKADGKYGNGTKKAVREIQKALDLTADGLWGSATEEAYMGMQDDVKGVWADLKGARTDIRKKIAWTDRETLTPATAKAIGWGNRKNPSMTVGGQIMTTLRLAADAAAGIKRTEREMAEIADDVEAMVKASEKE